MKMTGFVTSKSEQIMGVEYKIKIERIPPDMDKQLRSFPFFAEFDQTSSSFNFREDKESKVMPNAEMRIEKDGFYLCDYGMSRSLFGSLMREFIARFGSIQIMDYELSEKSIELGKSVSSIKTVSVSSRKSAHLYRPAA